jgi:two-component system response regulator RegA
MSGAGDLIGGQYPARYDGEILAHVLFGRTGDHFAGTCAEGSPTKAKRMTDLAATIAAQPDRTLLIVEDDKSFLQRLARAMEGRGFAVTTAETVADGLAQVDKVPPAFAVVDMRLGDGNGLDVISALRKRRPDARGIVLTGYGNIATAVTAVKSGAFDYLSKPADADEVAAALLALEGRKAEPPENPMSADRVRWEHIQRIYELCGRNVSETARRLNMHRRTLQRILAKRAPK